MKKLHLFFVFLLFCCLLAGQKKQAFIQGRNGGFQIMPVKKNDLIEVKTDSAYLLSLETWNAYRGIALKYSVCIEEKMHLNKEMYMAIFELDKLFKELNGKLMQQNAFSAEFSAEAEKKLQLALNKINGNLTDLEMIHASLEETNKRLNKVKKDIRKERIKQAWLRFGDWIVAGGIGFLVGILASD